MDYELPSSDNDLWAKYDNLILADLLTQCRYYHGETLCPSCFVFSINENFWNYEKRWVEANANHETHFLKNMLVEYVVGGLAPFNTNDGTPSTLKALLYNRFIQFASTDDRRTDASSFINWYKTNYLRNGLWSKNFFLFQP